MTSVTTLIRIAITIWGGIASIFIRFFAFRPGLIFVATPGHIGFIFPAPGHITLIIPTPGHAIAAPFISIPVSPEITAFIPQEHSLILVDEAQWQIDNIEGRCAVPFLERDGQYWGVPPDDATAIHELERLREAGASFIVFGWPAFWWLDHYIGLRQHLYSKYACVQSNIKER